MKRFFLWLKRWWLYRWDCPACEAKAAVKWVKDWVYHPEEPPMFYHFECLSCQRRTDTAPTMITEDAAKGLGYRDFGDYAEKVLKL